MKCFYPKLIGIALIIASGVSAKSVRTYDEVTGSVKNTYICTLDTVGSTIRLTTVGTTETTIALVDETGAVQRATIKTDSTEMVIQRTGNTLVPSTGKPIKISEKPWYVDLSSVAKTLKAQKKVPFWIASADFSAIDKKSGMQALPMVASFVKIDTISVNGQATPAIYATVTFADWRSIFWKSHYWFRLSDGVMIRNESVRGGPGTKKTVMNLIREEVRP